MFVNGQLVKLGKRTPVMDPRINPKVLQFKKYRKAMFSVPALPPAPAETSWITKLEAAEPIPMYLNDQLGDCVEAAAGHMIQQWNYYAGHPAQPSDADILKAYEDVGGYVPGDPSTDQGTDMQALLDYWKSTGIGGHKIIAYLAVDWENLEEVQLAVELFGNLFTGIQLPTSAQGQNDWTVPNGGVYSAAGQPGGWGGHGIPIVAGSPVTKTCETWGTVLKMSNNFFTDYVDETWAVLSKEWIEANGLSPSLLNLPMLESDLNEMGTLWKAPK